MNKSVIWGLTTVLAVYLLGLWGHKTLLKEDWEIYDTKAASAELSPGVETAKLPPLTVKPSVGQQPKSPADLYQKARRFTVDLLVTFEDPTGDPRRPNYPLDEKVVSGFVIQAGTNYYVLSASHVIPPSPPYNNARFYAQFFNRQRQELTVAGFNQVPLDVALFKFKNGKFIPPAAAPLGDSRLVKIGDPVAAIGSPYGFKGFFTNGVVGAMDLIGTSPLPCPAIIGSNVHISPGNSGGPLLNSRGEVIGLNQGVYGGSPMFPFPVISMSIPATDISLLLPKLMSGGSVTVGWLGYHILDSREIPQLVQEELMLNDKNLPGPTVVAGFLGVSPATPRDIVNALFGVRLLEGDLILSYAGSEVKTAADICRLNLLLKPSDRVEIIVLRRGKKLRKIVELIELRPPNALNMP